MPAAPSNQRSDATAPLSFNPILERTQSQWLFTPSELQRAPSIIDGMPLTQEHANRSKGVNFITQVGILLKLPQLTLATASVYLHRFFMRYSMVDLPARPGLHHYAVAATSLFLATKVEENCRKMRELVVACCRVAQKQPNLVVDEQSKEYWKWRDTILHNEDLLLEALCFDLQLDQPYRILFDFLCYYGVQDNRHLRNVSWAWINDASLTTMCLLFPARVVAGTALYAAARFSGVTLPDDNRGRPWWDHLRLEISDIGKAVNLMAEIYEDSVIPRQGQKGIYVKDDAHGPNSTRMVSSPSGPPSPGRSPGLDSQGVKRDRSGDDVSVMNGEMNGISPAGSLHALSTQSHNELDRGLPSPKRQRRQESPEGGGAPIGDMPVMDPQSQTSNPLPASSQGPRAKSIDDVQQRIDDIIKATSSTTSSHPPLSRRTSQRQQPWSGSSAQPDGSSARRPSHDWKPLSRQTSHDRDRCPDGRGVQHGSNENPSQASVEGYGQGDEEMARSGSEEGEL